MANNSSDSKRLRDQNKELAQHRVSYQFKNKRQADAVQAALADAGVGYKVETEATDPRGVNYLISVDALHADDLHAAVQPVLDLEFTRANIKGQPVQHVQRRKV